MVDINTIYMIAIVVGVLVVVGAILGVVFSLQRRAQRHKALKKLVRDIG